MAVCVVCASPSKTCANFTTSARCPETVARLAEIMRPASVGTVAAGIRGFAPPLVLLRALCLLLRPGIGLSPSEVRLYGLHKRTR